jgi:hypothetical protein
MSFHLHPLQFITHYHPIIQPYILRVPVTVPKQSTACTVFARSEAGTMGSNPTRGMDVWCLFVCVCVCVHVFPVFLYRQRPCDELINHPRSPAKCLRSSKLK